MNTPRASVAQRITAAAGRFAETAGALAGKFQGARLRGGIQPERGIGPTSDGIDSDEQNYRRVTGGRQPFRDLSDQMHNRQLELAYLLYLSSPIARRAMEITRDFVVGDGITFRAVDPNVQATLDSFWRDPINRWDLKQFNRALEIGLYGEQFYPISVEATTGRVRLGYLDPLFVEKVITDPNNVEITTHVVLKADAGAPAGTAGAASQVKPLRIVGPDENPLSPTFGHLTGEVFFFAINKVSNAVRGNSDLLPVIDWIDTHEQFLFGIHEAANLKTSVIWDVLCHGADEKKLEALEKRFGVIRKGMVRIHNEKVVTTAVAPQLETADLADHSHLIKVHIAAGLGLPEHWLSEGGNSNRATAQEMGVPTTKRLRSRQIFFNNMVAYIFDFVIDQAIIAGMLDKNVDRTFKIFSPPIWAIDTSMIATSLLTTAQGLQIAQDMGWISDGDSREIFALVASQLGTTLHPAMVEAPVAASARTAAAARPTPSGYERMVLSATGGNGHGGAQ